MRKLFQSCISRSFKNAQQYHQTIRGEKLAQISPTIQSSHSNSHLKELNKHMRFLNFSSAVTEIDRLTQQKVDLPIQEILGQFVKNSQYELTNQLYSILENAKIPLSDISYVYLIDSNLTEGNFTAAQNIAIHAYLSGEVLDVETYLGLFNAVPHDADPTFRFQLYKQYREYFKLNNRILFDLQMLAEATKDPSLLSLLESDAQAQGIQLPKHAHRLIRKSNAISKSIQQTTEENIITPNTNKNPELDYQLENMKGLENEFPTKKFEFKSIQEQQEELVGSDLLKFIKQGQQSGVFNSKQPPLIFVLKSQQNNLQNFGFENSELGEMSDEDNYIPLNERESLHEFSDSEDEEHSD